MPEKDLLYHPVSGTKCFEHTHHTNSFKYQYDQASDQIDNGNTTHKTDQHIPCKILKIEPVKDIWINITDRLCIPCNRKVWHFINSITYGLHFSIIMKKDLVTANFIFFPVIESSY